MLCRSSRSTYISLSSSLDGPKRLRCAKAFERLGSVWASTYLNGNGHLWEYVASASVPCSSISPARRNAASTFNVLTGNLPSDPSFPRVGARADDHALAPAAAPLPVVRVAACQWRTVSRHFSVFTQPPVQETSSLGQVSMTQSSKSVAEERTSGARWVRPARM